MSVESTSATRVTASLPSTAVPTSTGAWTFAFWSKINSYATQFTQCFSWVNFVGDHILGADTGELTGPPGTTLDGFAVAGGSFDPKSLLTGGYTGWAFIGCTYPGSGTVYTFYVRKQGVTTFTTFTVDVGFQLDLNDNVFNLFADGFATADTRLRSFFMQATQMSSATLLTASQSLLAPAGTNTTFLPLDDATTAGTNAGTGANWTINGTLITQAGDNPDPTAGFGGAPDNSLFFGAGSSS